MKDEGRKRERKARRSEESRRPGGVRSLHVGAPPCPALHPSSFILHPSSFIFPPTGGIVPAMTQDRLAASLDIDRASTSEIVRIIQEQDALVAVRSRPRPDGSRRRSTRSPNGSRTAAGSSMPAPARAAGLRCSTPRSFSRRSASTRRSFACSWPAASARSFDRGRRGGGRRECRGRGGERHVKADDALVGIAASGTTPFTVTAVRRANMLGALTVG